jgi:hypothetical protein
MGFARTQLSGSMGAIKLNGAWLIDAPSKLGGFSMVGKEVPSQLVVYHQGSNPGVFATFKSLLETQNAIMVLSNSLALVLLLNGWGKCSWKPFWMSLNNRRITVNITKDTVDNALAWFELCARLCKWAAPVRPRDH